MMVNCFARPSQAQQPIIIPPGAREIDTNSKPIKPQIKKTYPFPQSQVAFSNEFPSARMSSVSEIAPNQFEVLIEMENFPINDSPWYAFKVWCTNSTEKEIEIHLRYPREAGGNRGTHRYPPKISTDGVAFRDLEPDRIAVSEAKDQATIKLKVGPSPLWVTAQELLTSEDMKRWSQKVAREHPFVRYEEFATLKSGRKMQKLTLQDRDPSRKRIVILFTRQHPPEVTGAFAFMKVFETLCEDTDAAREFRKNYTVMAYPMVNPDGVDEGHWRHNLGGVDLNRDWGFFHQEETRAMAKDFEQSDTTKFALSMDFHSTFNDVIYLMEPSHRDPVNDLPSKWTALHRANLPGRDITVTTVAHTTYYSTTVYWLYDRFKTQSIVYEVGDGTDRKELQLVAKSAATALMEVLKK